MRELPTILEQRGIASKREVAEALARSELHGGHLVTSLLQFAEVEEEVLLSALSECYELPSVAAGPLPQPDHKALIRIPREVAERYCCTPLSSVGSVLIIAVAQPLERGVEEELGYALGIELRQQVALEVRIRQAISRDYQVPLAPRHLRGVARLERDFDNAPDETPLDSWPVSRLSRLPRPPSEPPRPRAAGAGPSKRSSLSNRPRARGPISLSAARRSLIKEQTRDGAVSTYFDFVSQFFEYTALFAVHNALAEGLDSRGPGASPRMVKTIGVPLDLPSSLATAVETGEPLLGLLQAEGIDEGFARDVQRQAREAVLLLPVQLRGRCVLLLYGDNGSNAVRDTDLADVLSLSKDVGPTLERIILERKRRREVARSGRDTVPSTVASFPPPTIEAPLPEEAAPTQFSARAQAAPAQPAAPPTPTRAPSAAMAEPGPADPPQQTDKATYAESLPAQRVLSIEPANESAAAAVTHENEEREKPFLLDKSRSTAPPEVEQESPRPTTSISYPSPKRVTQRLPSVIVSEPPLSDGSNSEPNGAAAPATTKDDMGIDVVVEHAPSPTAEAKFTDSAASQAAEPASAPERSADEPVQASADSPATPAEPSVERVQPQSIEPPRPGEAPARVAASPSERLVQEALSGSAEAVRRLSDDSDDQSLSALLEHFPGPVITERAGPDSRASECGPLLQALANIGQPATPDISRFSQEGDDHVRRWATLLLGELPNEEACQAVAQRLGDPSPRVRQAATDAARLLLRSNAANLFRRTLFDIASSDDREDHLRLRALEHIARLHDTASVPRLVTLLEETRGTLAHKVMWALTVITRQDFGRDIQAWTQWWQQHQSEHRIQWLMEALTHSDRRLRQAAGEELKRETGNQYDFDPSAPLEHRTETRERYREWWRTTGARRFGRLC